MEIKVLEEKANPLLKRREFSFEISHATAATPKREEVRAEFAKVAQAPKDRVIIERMHARFGTATTRGEAMVYETAGAAKAIVREHILVRNGLKEKTVKASPAPAAAPEAPAAPAAPAPAQKKE
ncbi:MAG TPA: 30S ribosomal protein S24e [Thermoplasmata archaeon]|nr:30S ribosomal protein S24e [Thermoplasmata archaeon]